jgi:putative sugar O-methyltransferase
MLARLQYFVYSDAVRRKDIMRLLGKLREDGAFGCLSFEFAGIGTVSRDLLDSVVELNFLHKHLRLLARDDVRVLDVGAGYGRMACRMLEAHPRTKSYTCVDAVPESTFLCEFYIKFRGLEDKVRVVPMHDLEDRLVPNGYDIALNIHSFSECTHEAIRWWLTRIRQLNIRYLMIVPNETDLLSVELDMSRRDYAPLLKALGYERIASEPVFEDPAVQELLGSRDHMFLFECREAGRALG